MTAVAAHPKPGTTRARTNGWMWIRDEYQLVPPAVRGALEPALCRRRGVRDRTAELVEGHHSDDGQRQRREAGATAGAEPASAPV
jgi:hypothetical protein